MEALKTQRHAYMIMAHNQWDLLYELLRALDDPRNDIYLHIDKKASVPYEKLLKCICKSRLIFTKRFNIVWGGTQMMECTLEMLETAYNKDEYSYYHLISGTDYPLKNQNEIHEFFNINSNRQFVGFDWFGINNGLFSNRAQYYHFLINIIGKRDKNAIAIVCLP